jgi:transposase InsO family protein
MRFAFIQSHARIWHITTMCRVLEVSRAGYYAWRVRPLCERVKTDQVLTAKICEIQEQVRRRYGSPRVRMELRALGFPVGKHRVGRLMRQAGVLATPRRAYRVTTQSDHAEPIAPNRLARQFALAAHPQRDQTWAADLTYIPTREGWLYLAVVLDLASRRVVGWALRTRLTEELATTALRMALTHRGAREVLHHSDRGVQYASRAYQQLLRATGCTPSMSRVGDCWDNAVVESFFATLTKELLGDRVFATRDAASRAVVEFIESWYNRRRRHSTLGYRTPVEYEEQVLGAG